MAFHQPTRQAVQRIIPAAEYRTAPTVQTPTHQRDQQVEESQTWVLFSPATEVTTTSYLCETEKSQETPGRSRFSDLGSLNTLPRTAQHDQSIGGSLVEADEEEDAELDSLDSHLPEFRSLPGYYASSNHGEEELSVPVLPGHDGLGSFRLGHPVHSTEAQEQMYQFEKFNPRRVKRRRESIDRAPVEGTFTHAHAQEAEKRHRIEEWRLEHSRILLDEVRKETRRRRLSHASLQHVREIGTATPRTRSADSAESDNMAWHDEDAISTDSDQEGFLVRFTRKVVRDILGIDDRMLEILIGEAVPEEGDLSDTPKASYMDALAPMVQVEESWQTQILERVSRELGLLVNHLSHHPGAFSTYARLHHTTIPYAGLPAIPESAPQLSEDPRRALSTQFRGSLEFQPTAPQPMNIPSRRPATPERTQPGSFTKEEWEQELDIKLVFRYLRSRFTSRSSAASHPTHSTSHLATTSTADTAAKAARVRQHHPLVSRARPTGDRRPVIERRISKASTQGSPAAAAVLRHVGGSSCASQSTRRSARRSSVTGSSRHYWDIGGSLGTGSVVASHGAMGSWGEV